MTAIFAGCAMGAGGYGLRTACALGALVVFSGALAGMGNARRRSPNWLFLPVACGTAVALASDNPFYRWLFAVTLTLMTAAALLERRRRRTLSEAA